MATIDITENKLVLSDLFAVVDARSTKDTINLSPSVTVGAQGAGIAIFADGFGDTLNLNGIADSLHDDAVVVGTTGEKDSGGNVVTLTQTGFLNAREDDNTALTLHGDGNKLTNGGLIDGGKFGVLVDGAFTRITNSGVIHGGEDGIHVTDDDVLIRNNASISGNDEGINIESNRGSIVNAGQVAGSVFGIAATGEGAKVINTGTVSGDFEGIGLANDDGNSGTVAGHASLSNNGHVTAGVAGLVAFGDDIGIRNGSHGVVEALVPGGAAVLMRTEAGVTQTLLNDGVLKSKGLAIQGGDGVEIVTNHGTMTGGAALGGGNDVFNSKSGHVTGTIDGGAGNDTLVASSDNNALDGGLGRDILTGGAGNDTFQFKTQFGPTNLDHITDFSAPADAMQLENAFFKGLAVGELNAAFFKDIGVAGAHVDANDRILYNHTTGALSFDADGSGAGKAVQFATLDNHAVITAHDFFIV